MRLGSVEGGSRKAVNNNNNNNKSGIVTRTGAEFEPEWTAFWWSLCLEAGTHFIFKRHNALFLKTFPVVLQST